MEIKLPQNVVTILNILQGAGHEAYCVGGAVRDSLMGFSPEDWDITTSAKPDETKSLFKDYKTVDTGLKHGTLTVIMDHKPYEITTFRIDGQYNDNRHPEDVVFTADLKNDLARRDFTVNAVYAERCGKPLGNLVNALIIDIQCTVFCIDYTAVVMLVVKGKIALELV